MFSALARIVHFNKRQPGCIDHYATTTSVNPVCPENFATHKKRAIKRTVLRNPWFTDESGIYVTEFVDDEQKTSALGETCYRLHSVN